MHPHLRKLIDTRPPGNPNTPEFLRALGDDVAADLYDEAMGKDASPSTTEGAQEQELTPDELALARAAEARLRETQEKKDLAALKADYLAWARDFKLGGDDREEWISDTFTFNLDGTVAVDDDLDLSGESLTRLPPALTRVNGYVDLAVNLLTSLDGLLQEIHGDLYLSYNRLTSLESLRGKKIDGDLYLRDIPAQVIPEGIKLVGKVIVNADQTLLKEDAISKGYFVDEY